MKTCDVLDCGQSAPFYWNKPYTTVYLCSEHYDAMEREVHTKEKAMRILSSTIGVITGKEHEFIKCPNGESCRWCKEILAQPKE